MNIRKESPSVQLSVVVPSFNGAGTLGICLEALRRTSGAGDEIIVVDDGSTDGTAEVAAGYGAIVVTNHRRSGPAAARNLGAGVARNDLLLFLDADVVVGADTIRRIREAFAADEGLVGLIGSYDFAPSAQGFVSRYRNLLHSFVHQRGRRQTIGFWGACGAIRKEAFAASGGFDPSYSRPSIEDIELGYRLRRLGFRVDLDPEVRVKHMKRWTLGTMIRTDVVDRAIPWTRLMLREGEIPNDLNVKVSQRLCVALVGVAPVAAVMDLNLAALLVLTVLLINWRLYAFLAEKWGGVQAVASAPLHLLYFFYSGVGMAVGILLHLSERWAPGLAPERELK